MDAFVWVESLTIDFNLYVVGVPTSNYFPPSSTPTGATCPPSVLTSPDEQESIDDEAFLIGSIDEALPRSPAPLLYRYDLPTTILIPPGDKSAHLISAEDSTEELGPLEVSRLPTYYAQMKRVEPDNCKLVGVGQRQRMTQFCLAAIDRANRAVVY